MSTSLNFTIDPNSPDIFRRTRLHYTVRLGHLSETRSLLYAGLDVNAIDVFGGTPLSIACVDKPNIKMVKLLLEHNADINQERPNNMDLLLECVLNCRTTLQESIIKILIRHGKNVNSTDEVTNRSCMHIVALTGYIPIAEYFLKVGGIVNIIDNFNCTPIRIALIHENVNVLKLMESQGNRLI